MNTIFLIPTQKYYEMIFLLSVKDHHGISLPPEDPEHREMLSHISLTSLIEDGVLVMLQDGTERIILSRSGSDYVKGLTIDYYLELMDLRHASDRLMFDRVKSLERHQCHRILLYGASDTAKVLLEFLKTSDIRVQAVIDDDPTKQGCKLLEVPIIAPTQISNHDFDSIVVTTIAFQKQVLEKARAIVPDNKKLFGLFDDI